MGHFLRGLKLMANLKNNQLFCEFKQTLGGDMVTFFSHTISEESSVCHVRNLEKIPQLPSGFTSFRLWCSLI